MIIGLYFMIMFFEVLYNLFIFVSCLRYIFNDYVYC